MKFIVDRIEGEFAILESLSTKETIDVALNSLPVVKEKDVLIFENNLYRIDNEERNKRMSIIREKIERLKRK